MPRRKLSEYRAKVIAHETLDLPYEGWSVTSSNFASDVKKIASHKSYVVKVDQAVKGRFKKGLVALDVPKAKIASIVKKYEGEGYKHFIVEPYVTHEDSNERYLSIAQDRQGIRLSYSELGGVDIESNPDSVKSVYLTEKIDWEKLAEEAKMTTAQLQALFQTFKDNYFVFLEINPYILTDKSIAILDIAVEVDDAGETFVKTWSDADIREPNRTVAPEEEVIRALDKTSVASFNLSVINPQGSIFLLLSGGGASVTIADEVYNLGLGKELANYGEYSGAPQAHEARKYTSEVLKLLLASKAPKKILFIGGAVANFTDIATTFAGVIAAIDECADELARQNVKIYVRRGGPRQEIGLKNIRQALEKYGLLGGVYDPSTTLTDALSLALKGLK
jgi:ATP-citrate lyase beta-subunit